MWIFNKRQEPIEEPKQQIEEQCDPLLQALIRGQEITKSEALNIPCVLSATELITNTFAMIPFKLYRKEDLGNGKKKVVEVEDYREGLINREPHDSLDGFQMKKAIAQDYLLDKGGYLYINRSGNEIDSLHYVEPINVSVSISADPIFKSYDILVNGKTYKPFDFVKFLRNSTNGATGTGLITQINQCLQVAYQRILFEKGLMSTSGAKRGFLQSKHRLSEGAMNSLKEAWQDFYSGSANAMVLNDGVEFKESSNTSVENQIVEKNKSFAREIDSLFHITDSYDLTIKNAIMPLTKAFETALNRDLLLESEKNELFWSADYNELLKGDLKSRYEAYQIAIKNGFKTINEVRYLENDNELEGLDVVTLSLAQVLYNTNDGTIYTPNTNQQVKMGEQIDKQVEEVNLLGGENIENTHS